MRKLSIIIPVFNEVATCRELFKRVADKKVAGYSKEIVVIESNSTDGSRQLAQEFAAQNPEVRLILEEAPSGKGHAVREGLKAATGDIIIIQDADLEYDINDYDLLLKPFENDSVDLVLGSRHLGKRTWQIRNFKSYPGTALVMNFGHTLFTLMFNAAFGQRLTDPATMYKVFRRSCLEGLEFECDRFDFDFELLGKLIMKGYEPQELPVFYQSRSFKAGKKIRFFRDPLTWFKVIFKTRFLYKAPPKQFAEKKSHKHSA